MESNENVVIVQEGNVIHEAAMPLHLHPGPILLTILWSENPSLSCCFLFFGFFLLLFCLSLSYNHVPSSQSKYFYCCTPKEKCSFYYKSVISLAS